MESKLTGYQRALIDMTVGVVVGIKSGSGIRKKIYRVEPVTRVTTAQIIVGRDRFWKRTGKQVDGLGYIEIMTAGEIKRWRTAQELAAEQAKLRKSVPTDDGIEAALRALRDKARTLCEHLQVQVENRLRAGASSPDWWPEYLQMLVEIEKSESALPSIGLSTNLKPSAAQSSLF
jgi:hypothetical protein